MAALALFIQLNYKGFSQTIKILRVADLLKSIWGHNGIKIKLMV